jgi:hypothetical protein
MQLPGGDVDESQDQMAPKSKGLMSRIIGAYSGYGSVEPAWTARAQVRYGDVPSGLDAIDGRKRVIVPNPVPGAQPRAFSER